MSESPELANWFRFLLPTIVFVTSGFVAFSTGTSFGTMGILLPIVVPLAHGTLGGEAAAFESDPLMLASVGSVLAGAIFGDHCSPISDTTILSSQASGCDHVAHVTTQLPYALLGAAVSILLGTLLLGFGINVWILLGLQTSALLAFVLLVGRQSET
jgi:Na+/H+ antiporter NhaC